MKRIIYSSKITHTDAPLVELWSLHCSCIWERLRSQRVLYVAPELTNHLEDWPDSYDWMKNQTIARTGCRHDVYPWWAWYQPKPDLRKRRLLSQECADEGGYAVMIHLRLPRERVLLSHLQAWDMALLHGYVTPTAEEYDFWEQRLQEAGLSEAPFPLPEPWNREMLLSWERMFDIEAIIAGNMWGSTTVQATFCELRLKDVVSVTSF